MIGSLLHQTIEIARLPAIYRLPELNQRPLYRGDVIGAESTGMLPKLFSKIDTADTCRVCASLIRRDLKAPAVQEMFADTIEALKSFELANAFKAMKLLLESGGDDVIDLFIKWHTDCLPFSPFVSTTFSPKIAQTHASNWDHSTIYELNIAPDRIVVDAKNEGGTDAGGEALVFGGISPTEIIRIKFPNVPENSELLEGHWLKNPRDFDLTNYSVKNVDHWRAMGESHFSKRPL